MRIIQVYDKMDRYGGAQSVLIGLDSFFLTQFDEVYVSAFHGYSRFVFHDKVEECRYLEFKPSSLAVFSNSIILSHSRKVTTYLMLISKLLRINLKVVHISHNVFNNGRLYTLYPRHVIAVSHAVKNNLIQYFGVSKLNIEVIYNGLYDVVNKVAIPRIGKEITIAFVARIESTKQQLSVVKHLSGKLHSGIKIDFIGEGADAEELKEYIKNSPVDNFQYIGFRGNIPSLISEYNFVLLFSKKEGLGLTLVEGCMAGRPLIAKGNNGSEACQEVCEDGYNGFIVNSLDDLVSVLNDLIYIDNEKYVQLCVSSRNTYEKKFKLEIMESKYKEYLECIGIFG